jgi:prolipoprotein diacylglyceryltransferase
MTYALLVYVGIALALAAILSIASWATEIVLGRRMGVFLSYAGILIVAVIAARLLYMLLKPCELIEIELPTRHECEWSPLYVLLLGCLLMLTLPSLVFSTTTLSKWSDARVKRLT